jgi:DNA-3-methyladenine glycosylase II
MHIRALVQGRIQGKGNDFNIHTLNVSDNPRETLVTTRCCIAATMILKLNETILHEACLWLAKRDAQLAQVVDRYGPPPLWAREPGFATLVHIILEQQVSLASANAAFQKLKNRLGAVTPEHVLALNDDALRETGFSRQKIRYTRALADAVTRGLFVLENLEHAPDDDVRRTLTTLPGIGHWTADIYLSECLLRPDILPRGDIAMQEAFRALKGWAERPDHHLLEQHTAHWRPWRSVGSRLLWHHYLCERGRKNTIGV